MNTIEKLLSEMCPEGVATKTVGDLCQIKTGKKDVNQGNPTGVYPFFTCSRNHTYSDSYSFDGEALLVAGNGDVGLVQYFKGKFEAYQRTYVLMNFETIDVQFLSHYLRAFLVQHLSVLKQDGTIPYIKLGMLKDFEIPVPPIEVQHEIVRILDAFTKLESELECELKARRLQYEFYRDGLLHVESVQGEVVTLGSCLLKVDRVNWKAKPEVELDYVDLSSVDRESKTIVYTSKIMATTAPSRAQQLIKEHDVLFGTTRPTLNRLCLVPAEYDGQVASTGFCVLRVDPDKMLPNYLLHLMNTASFQLYVAENQEGASYPSISDGAIKSFSFKLPSLQEQVRVSDILDKFLAIVIDVNSGLPAEIVARRHQYEYYRSKLLTFKKLEVA